jgi:phospholipid/cholesterol/gamma-HCH transport system substrate-binding protein
MENKAHALIAGLFTIVLLAAAAAIALWLNRDRIERVPYELATKLSVPGLNPQAAVRYRGLDVGRVDEISFDPQVPGQILVHISVNPDTPVTRSTYGILGYQGVTGIAYVQLDDDGTNPVRLPSSKEKVARIELRPSLLDTLQNKGMAIMIQVEELAKRVNTLMAPENQEAVLAAFNNVSEAASQLETIPRQLEPALAKLPALASEAQRSLEAITRLTREVNGMTASLRAPGGPIEHLSSAVEDVSGTAGDVSAVARRLESELLPLTSEVRSSLRTFNRTLEGVGSRPQSLLFGAPPSSPGPGEDGFVAPAN